MVQNVFPQRKFHKAFVATIVVAPFVVGSLRFCRLRFCRLRFVDGTASRRSFSSKLCALWQGLVDKKSKKALQLPATVTAFAAAGTPLLQMAVTMMLVSGTLSRISAGSQCS